MTYQQHPMSAVFPAMSAEDFLALKDSIEIIGVQNPITLYEGMVLDGWHRYQASQELGMKCPEQQLPPDTDPHDFVKAQNKERRHLSAGAWALIEAELWEWMAPHRPSQDKGAPGAPLARKVADMAAGLGVSERTMQQAGKVKTDAIPEIKAAVKAGEVSLRTAHAVTELPPAEQKKLVEQGPAAIKEVARQKRQSSKRRTGPDVDAVRLSNAKAELLSAQDRIAELEEKLEAALDANEELRRENFALQAAADPHALNTIQALQQQVLTVEQSRDNAINERAEAVREVKRLQRQLDRARAVSA